MIFLILKQKSGGSLTNASCLESFKIQKQPSNMPMPFLNLAEAQMPNCIKEKSGKE